MIDTQVPNAAVVPNAVVPNVGINVAPPTNGNGADPALDGFAKIAAERRTRAGTITATAIPFGSATIRIYSTEPAEFAIGMAVALRDSAAAVDAIRAAIVDDDKPEFERVLKLGPNNPDGIDGEYLANFMEHLARFYGGIPLDA